MKLVWTEKAKARMAEILDHIELEFGIASRQSFREKAKDFTRLLIEFPEIGTLEIKDKNLRGFQLTKQTRIFYRIKKDQIVILTFFDSRQDPKKRPL
ncbi:MAG TPA: type II toxin-antitoxin system RelE/ParE family toxin [Cyclobacteriaceae bacterium]|nr:type II toxin-antitoxin system RelE/ParE family toxin [Cyclobacteriaceae bacterium]HRK53158.1 type II toxin-antitoxin system RelE/ParE family toxin [Cyclobacteriaceae bacterium]